MSIKSPQGFGPLVQDHFSLAAKSPSADPYGFSPARMPGFRGGAPRSDEWKPTP